MIPPRRVKTEDSRTKDCVGYANFLTNNRDDAREIAAYLSTHLSDIMLRRLKRDVWPSNTLVKTYHGTMTTEEQQEYSRLYSMGVDVCRKNTTKKAQLITLMLRLRQLCSSALWKFEALRDHLESLPGGTKSLVFCTFREEIQRVVDTLGDIGIVMQYHGHVPHDERAEMLATFREETYTSMVMVLQIHCGGTGLNLQDAQHVFIMSPTWSPSTERQAIGRADRATTRHLVKVHRFVTSHSMESYMIKRQHTKDAVAQSLLRERFEDITGHLINSNGMMETDWADVCDIETLFSSDE